MRTCCAKSDPGSNAAESDPAIRYDVFPPSQDSRLSRRAERAQDMTSGSRPSRVRGRIRVRFGATHPDRMAFTMNVSQTGAFISTNNVFAPGKTIKIEFNFENESPTLFAQVMWAKKVPPQMAHLLSCGMGVRLINPGPEWGALLEEWESSRGSR